MGVRNCADIGENLIKISRRLLANENLMKLLYYTDKDPYAGEPLTEDQIQKEVFNKLVRVVPRVAPSETANSIVAIRVVSGSKNAENNEFKNVLIAVEVFVPLTQWFIKDENLRPFAILGEIEKSLNNKTINGLGKMTGGYFALNFLTDEISCYEQTFSLISYE